MDKIRSESVFKVFCDLYEKGLIYRGVRMVNWDPKALTAVSDEEVNYKEQQGKLYYLKYKIVENGKDTAGLDILAGFQEQLSGFSEEKRRKINTVLQQIAEEALKENKQ
jgi:valyl-tRNA synthetase